MAEAGRATGQTPNQAAPSSTYRLQLRPELGFAGAARLTGYLARLGISHLYASPSLQAVPGSQHGYDVVDPGRVDRELGGRHGHRRLSAALKSHGLGQVLDIVPNHMATSGPENAWWWDVLEKGRSSNFASTFDVRWERPESGHLDRILLPILGADEQRVLEAGELTLERHGSGIRLRYHEHLLPLSPGSLEGILPAEALDEELEERLDDVLAAASADPLAMEALLSRQAYRLTHWRAGQVDLGYRRFFDVSSLIGVRVEDEVVFTAVRVVVERWLAHGVIDGLRVDHPDGLHDPATYLARLRAAAPGAWVVVEKILMPGESLPGDWPVDGTTGYDFLRDVTGVLVDPAGEGAFDALLARLTGERRSFADIEREARLLIVRETLAPELNQLTAGLLAICEGRPPLGHVTRAEVQEVLGEVIASMPVYRTYGQPETGFISTADMDVIERAFRVAREARADLEPELVAFVGDILRLRVRGHQETRFVRRFQQTSGAVMAKGVEDTAFYRYPRLLALNEVGSDPGRFGLSVAGFHASNAARGERWPATMLTTSTHDTKRSEDVRARLAALSEMPDAWERLASRWMRRFRRLWSGVPFDPLLGYHAAQTLAGAWPIDGARLAAHLLKAAREARLRTSWTEPDAPYEAAVEAFAWAVASDAKMARDLGSDLAPVIRAGRVNSLAQLLLKLTSPGVPDIYQGNELWDLSLVDPDDRRSVDFARRDGLLAELESALVRDPLAGPGPAAILARADEGLPKLWATRQVLCQRRARPDLFGPDADYEPVLAAGPRADHVIAFIRGGGEALAATIVPRLPYLLSGGRIGADLLPERQPWGSTAIKLPGGAWRDVLSGSQLRVRDGHVLRLSRILGAFPVALLVREADAASVSIGPVGAGGTTASPAPVVRPTAIGLGSMRAAHWTRRRSGEA